MANKRTEKLEANTVAGMREVRGIVRRNERTIKGLVGEWSSQSRFSTNAQLRNSMYKELSKEYAKFGSDIDEWTKKNVNDTAKDFWKYAKADMKLSGTFGAFSRKHIQDIMGVINPSTVSNLVAVNAAASSMRDSEIRALRAAVSTSIAEGAIEGLNNKQLADRMKLKVGDAAGKFQFVDRAGKKWKADNYFGMLNRTLHAESARRTYTAAGTDAGFDLYVIAGGVTGSSAEYPDDPCDVWAGRVFSMTGNTPGVATYDEALAAGVFHPNCVHFMRAVTKSEVARARQDGETAGLKTDLEDIPAKTKLPDTKAPEPEATQESSKKYAVPSSAKTSPSFDSDGFESEMGKLSAKQLELVDELPPPKFLATDKGTGSYSPMTRQIRADTVKRGGGTVRHEYGHHVDYMLMEKTNGVKFMALSANDRPFMIAYDEDRKLNGLHRSKTKGAGITKIREKIYIDKTETKVLKSGQEYKFTKSELVDEGMSGVSDILDALTHGQLQKNYGGFGHGVGYYKDKGARYKETFANMFELRNTKHWEAVEEFFPNMAKRFIELTEGGL